MHICIIGAGIVGTATAWELARHGHTITLLEAREATGLEASYANAGQLGYNAVAPLAQPGVWSNLPKWLLNDNSPMRLRLRLDPRQWRWGCAFLCACRSTTAQRTTAQLLPLSYLSRDVLAQWMAERPMAFAHREAGKLTIYRSPALLETVRKAVQRKTQQHAPQQAQTGTQEQILDAAACLRLEPALAGCSAPLAGGVYAANSAVGDCHRLTQVLAASLQTIFSASIHTGTRVMALERMHNRITAARLQNGERITADHFVLSNALGARPLLRALGDDVPLYGLKGYSLSLPVAQAPTLVPQVSIIDYERGIAYGRIGDALRIAALVDMGDTDTTPNPTRIALLKRQVAEVFPNLPLKDAQIWAGFRPSTPDGKPRIGRSKAASNLWLNLGHGALGFMLACGSAVVLRHLIQGDKAPIDSGAFQ